MSDFISTRYPYTYAYDYLRTEVSANISRGEMSAIVKTIAESFGVEPEVICNKLADKYLEKYNIKRE